MAVLALGFVGQAVGASIGGSILGVTSAAIGGFVGSTIGGLIDNMLFPSTQEGPRLNDLTITASTYGKPIPLLFGPENRIAGNVIWSTGLIETQSSQQQGGKGGPSVNVKTYSYRASFAVLVGEGELSALRKVWANNKLIYDADDPPPVASGLYADIRFYPGSMSQSPDPTIESYVGVGNAPAYVGTAYVVFEDLQLADYGNPLPNIQFLIEAQEETDPRAIVLDIIRRCGLDENLASTSSLVSEPVRGFAIGQASSGIGALQPLALAYDFDVSETAGALRCVPRGSSPVTIIPSRDLAGHEASTSRPPDAIRWSRSTTTRLPKEVTVTFPDPDRDYQPNTQRAGRSEGSAESNLNSEIPIVLTADQGRRLADRMLWEAWSAQQTGAGKTDDRWLSLEPARIYYFETPAGLEPLRLTRLTRGWNGVIDFEVRRDQEEVYLGSTDGVPAAVPDNTIRLPGLSEVILLDIPLLIDGDEATETGFYWGVVGSGPGWRGADFRRAVDLAGPYQQVTAQGLELTVGDVDGALPAPAGGFDSATDWDDTNVIQVTLRRGDMTLESLTDDEVLAGGNACYIGSTDGRDGEILQFANADLVSDDVYELSRLRRGQRGTEFAWSDHAADEMFVLLRPGSLQRSDFGISDVGLERFYKAVSLLTYEVDADAIPFENTGVGLRPYSPIDLLADGPSGGGDVDLSWTRRSRIGWPALDPPPLAEESEAYLVRIMNAAGTVVVREVATTAPSFDYTAAMQTADFGAPVATLRWRVAQVSDAYGAGIFAESNGPV